MRVVAVEQCDFDVQKAYDAATAIIEASPTLQVSLVVTMIWHLVL